MYCECWSCTGLVSRGDYRIILWSRSLSHDHDDGDEKLLVVFGGQTPVPNENEALHIG